MRRALLPILLCIAGAALASDADDDAGADGIAQAALGLAASPVMDAVRLDSVGGMAVGAEFPSSGALPRGWSEVAGSTRGDCRVVRGGNLPPGMVMVAADGRVARFDLAGRDAAWITAPFGLHLGQAAPEALAALPAGARSVATDSDEDGTRILWTHPGGRVRIRIEAAYDRVLSIHWGAPRAVLLPTPCA
jgi:hypothetical protein